MGMAGVVALATVFVAGGRELPRSPSRYLVVWGGGVKRGRYGGRIVSRGSPLAEVLRRYGVPVEEYRYRTTVKGRSYTRYKLVIRDTGVTSALSRLSRDMVRVRRLMKRFENVVLEVLSVMGRIKGWRILLNLIPWNRLRRWFGIKPFDYQRYLRWRNFAIVRYLKPNWRAWFYVKLKHVEGSIGFTPL